MKNEKINVIGAFDGMSCGQLALTKAGINYNNYYSFEIDRFAIQVANKNFPDTIQLGNIETYPVNELPKIDLLLGGSPCQGFSFSGKQLSGVFIFRKTIEL